MSSSFNVGDRVRYRSENVNKTDSFSKYKSNLIGTVINKDFLSDKEYLFVDFDKDQPDYSGKSTHLFGKTNGCYSANLEYISYRYDPSQAGDTDDDI